MSPLMVTNIHILKESVLIKLMMNQGKIYAEEILLWRLNFITIGIQF